MNTNQLKRFAQEARIKLINQITAKLELVLTADSAELREKTSQIKGLQEAINASSKAQVIDKVAYTWFNRFMALRFMDVNGYQPIGLQVVSPKAGYTLPELLDEAKQGHIPEELNVKRQHIYDLLDGKVPSTNAQNEAYKELLIGACNHLNTVFPFLFERINDYTELLLPEDLTSEFSILQDVRNGMSAEDCEEVEIIGWLYQFYISEKKDELINAKKRYKADEIAPVTQLFTPKWIVQYMVDNTLGQLWKEARPKTRITNDLEFYIKQNNPELIPSRNVKSAEDITFFDPCVGSAHVLCYAFDIFYKIYEEEGYNPTDIPELIISKNLFGIDIDDRAAQLASFALMMKGRKHHRRFFRKEVVPNITAFQNIASHPKFENAKVLGSLIKISKEEADEIEVDESTLFGQEQIQLKKQANLLANKYDIVVTNPPYLNSAYMEASLKQFVDKEYEETKSDLFACFLIQVSHFTKGEGLIGYISPCVWMFLKSYELLRKKIINKTTISSLVQLEYNAFAPAVVPIATFVLRNKILNGYSGSYIKLSEFTGSENQPIKTLEAIKKPESNWFYRANQKDFKNIDGNIISYWSSIQVLHHFKNLPSLSKTNKPLSGLVTGKDLKFIRKWFEVEKRKILFGDAEKNISNSWIPLVKGGNFRKWYGNYFNILFYNSQGNPYQLTNSMGYFKTNLNWSEITSSTPSFRFADEGYIFNKKGPSIIIDKTSISLLGYLNSKVANMFLNVLSQSISVNTSEVAKIPVKTDSFSNEIDTITKMLISVSRQEWNSHSYSMAFSKNELIRIQGQDIEETYDLYQQYWQNKFFQLHKNEEDLNKQFIEIYGLQEELTPDVPLRDITILKDELDQKQLRELSSTYKSSWKLEDGKWILEDSSTPKPELPFDAKEVFAQLMSYAVGCMFGRYSLDKEGLILANQGETLEDYLNKLQETDSKFQNLRDLSFVPDEDNIIPVLDDEWFEDDIVGRFYEFLKVSFGKENFDKNLAFVEDCLGKDIRRYFVRDFYADHIKRYKKRPIYWMFSSPKNSFNVLIYMHRYTPDTLNQILNDYLVEYREKLKIRSEHLDHIIETGSATEQTKASREKDKLKVVLLELQEYERDTLYPLATERIPIDLDDGVLVNYNKFGDAIKQVAGLNDKKTKKKVMGFDWIDVSEIH